MVFRKAPVRITPNFCSGRWLSSLPTGVSSLGGCRIRGGRSRPTCTVNAIAILGTAIELWGRFSSGRNIDFVLRLSVRSVIRGAYRFSCDIRFTPAYSSASWQSARVLLHLQYPDRRFSAILLFALSRAWRRIVPKTRHAACWRTVRWHWSRREFEPPQVGDM